MFLSLTGVAAFNPQTHFAVQGIWLAGPTVCAPTPYCQQVSDAVLLSVSQYPIVIVNK